MYSVFIIMSLMPYHILMPAQPLETAENSRKSTLLVKQKSGETATTLALLLI